MGFVTAGRDRRTSLLRRIWSGWLRFVTVLGTVQMVVLLTIAYWLFVPLMFIPFGLIADPLRSRPPRGPRWVKRGKTDCELEWMLGHG